MEEEDWIVAVKMLKIVMTSIECLFTLMDHWIIPKLPEPEVGIF